MTLTSLALACLGSWSYGSFLDEPSATPAASTAIEPTTTEPDTGFTQEAAATMTATPDRWRLTDASGQVWEDGDPVNLQRWVAQRNQNMAGPAAFTSGASCPGGVCPPPPSTQGLRARKVRIR